MQRFTETCRERKDTQRDVENHNTSKDYQRLPESFGRASKDTPETFQRLPKIPKIYRESQYFQRHPETSGAAQGTQHSLGDYKSPRDT